MKFLKKIPRNFSWKKFIKNFLLTIIIGTIIIISGASLFVLSEKYQKNFAGKKDCAVVFGAAVWRDDIPSHALFDRTIAGIELFKKGQVNCLIFSGGKSRYGTHEAEVMKKIALENKIPAKKIFLDYEGNNTWETLQNIRKNFAGKSFVFVSNDFHLARIRLIAWKMGIKDFALQSAKYQNGKYFKGNYFFWREVAGVLYYTFFDGVKNPAKFLDFTKKLLK